MTQNNDLDVLNKSVAEFCEQFKKGRICLHQTDTLLGLTFDPYNPKAIAELCRIKGRETEKVCLGIVSSAQKAREFFQTFPINFTDWPKQTSVIFNASDKAPPALVAHDGTLGLRVLDHKKETEFIHKVLKEFPFPLPSTSVNEKGKAPLTKKEDVINFCKQYQIYYSGYETFPEKAAPSRIIKLSPEGNVTQIR